MINDLLQAYRSNTNTHTVFHTSVYSFMHLSIQPSSHHLSIHLFFHPSFIHSSACLSIHPSIHSFLHPSIPNQSGNPITERLMCRSIIIIRTNYDFATLCFTYFILYLFNCFIFSTSLILSSNFNFRQK